VYLTAGFDGIGEAKDCVKCEFGRRSFDLRVLGFHGKSYRLRKENLEKEIDPAQSKVVVKKNKITITMRKVKGSYGYDHWLDLVAKRGVAGVSEGKAAEADPSAGLMDLMKQVLGGLCPPPSQKVPSCVSHPHSRLLRCTTRATTRSRRRWARRCSRAGRAS